MYWNFAMFAVILCTCLQRRSRAPACGFMQVAANLVLSFIVIALYLAAFFFYFSILRLILLSVSYLFYYRQLYYTGKRFDLGLFCTDIRKIMLKMYVLVDLWMHDESKESTEDSYIFASYHVPVSVSDTGSYFRFSTITPILPCHFLKAVSKQTSQRCMCHDITNIFSSLNNFMLWISFAVIIVHMCS